MTLLIDFHYRLETLNVSGIIFIRHCVEKKVEEERREAVTGKKIKDG